MERNIAIHIAMEVPNAIKELKPDLPAAIFYERKGLTHVNEKLFDEIRSDDAVRFRKDGQIYRGINSCISQIAKQEIIINPIIMTWIFDCVVEINTRDKFASCEDTIAKMQADLDAKTQCVAALDKEVNFLLFQCTKMGKYIHLYVKESAKKVKMFQEIEEHGGDLHDAIENEVACHKLLLNDEEIISASDRRKEKETVREEALLAKNDTLEREKSKSKKTRRPDSCLLQSRVIHGYMDDLPLYTWHVIHAQSVDNVVRESWRVYKDKLNNKKIELLLSVLQAVKLLSEDSICKLIAQFDL